MTEENKDSSIVKKDSDGNVVLDMEEVTVSKKFIDDLEKRLAAQEAKSNALESMTDRKLRGQYYSRHKEELPIHVKLRTWTVEGEEPSVILGWRTVRDEGAHLDPATNRLIEKQDIEIVLEDGKKLEMPLAAWNLRYGHVQCEQIGTTTDEKGHLSLKLRRKDNGKEYVVGVQYVN